MEAARADDAGKGFAVVAVEVRRLAQSAASASSDAKILVEQSANEVASGSKLVSNATAKLDAMVDSVRQKNELITEIARVTQEQSTAIVEVSTSVRDMDEMTQHNAALVEEMNAALEQTETQARELDEIVEIFVVEASPAPARRPAPRTAAKPAARQVNDVKSLQARAGSANKAYGNTAVKDDWNEF
ncbi:MAG: methyl-accepting chemotaxis protein [Candidatus Devosia euplotis]|nr:methyl-accepting chemotaxis protein [Candidatus Devosia euplotis]